MTYRRRQGIPPRKVRPPGERRKSWVQQYFDIWGKSPSESLTPEEFAEREPVWNAEVFKQQEAARRREVAEQRGKLERQQRRDERGRQRFTPPPSPVATPSVGRNQPCPCGSGRKFKKCCGP